MITITTRLPWSFSFIFLLLKFGPAGAADLKVPVVSRQVYAAPSEIVAALFTPGVPQAVGKGKSSSRLEEFFKITEKSTGADEVYFRLDTKSSFLTALLPEEKSVEVWVRGRRSRPAGPWKVRAKSPLGQTFSGEAWLHENKDGAAVEFQLQESSLSETVALAAIKLAAKAGIVSVEIK
ncbi:MAG: hypothetical protein AB7K68_03130 [Bacteriovoracia bacterium]